jgi:hypothetical protein
MVDIRLFIDACSIGCLDRAKLIYHINMDVSHNDDEAFRSACQFGHLEIVKFLLSLKPSINVSCFYELPFRRA